MDVYVQGEVWVCLVSSVVGVQGLGDHVVRRWVVGEVVLDGPRCALFTVACVGWRVDKAVQLVVHEMVL